MTEATDPTRKEMQALSAEITRLGGLWCMYVSFDHHKDRDCHFHVETSWSYGNPPKFQAHHSGYVGEYWSGPHRSSMVVAMRDLRNFLRGQLRAAYQHAVRDQGVSEEDSWADPRTIQYALENLGEFA